MDDVTNPLGRNCNFLGKPVLADPHGLEELLRQEFAGCHRIELLHTKFSQEPNSRYPVLTAVTGYAD